MSFEEEECSAFESEGDKGIEGGILVLPTFDDEGRSGLPTFEEEGGFEGSTIVGVDLALATLEDELLGLPTSLSIFFPDLRVVTAFTGFMLPSSHKFTPRELYFGFISVWLGNLPFSLFKLKIFITSAN